jgi:hypothetical protein
MPGAEACCTWLQHNSPDGNLPAVPRAPSVAVVPHAPFAGVCSLTGGRSEGMTPRDYQLADRNPSAARVLPSRRFAASHSTCATASGKFLTERLCTRACKQLKWRNTRICLPIVVLMQSHKRCSLTMRRTARASVASCHLCTLASRCAPLNPKSFVLFARKVVGTHLGLHLQQVPGRRTLHG